MRLSSGSEVRGQTSEMRFGGTYLAVVFCNGENIGNKNGWKISIGRWNPFC